MDAANTTTELDEEFGVSVKYYLVIGVVLICYLLGVITLLYNVCCKSKPLAPTSNFVTTADSGMQFGSVEQELLITEKDLENKIIVQQALIDDLKAKKLQANSALKTRSLSGTGVIKSGTALGQLFMAGLSIKGCESLSQASQHRRSEQIQSPELVHLTLSDIPPVLKHMSRSQMMSTTASMANALDLSRANTLIATMKKSLAESKLLKASAGM